MARANCATRSTAAPVPQRRPIAPCPDTGKATSCSDAPPSAIATLVERTSRVTVRVRLPHGRSSEPVLTALAECFVRRPDQLVRSLTLLTRAKRWRCTRSSRSIRASRSPSAIHAARGNEARTRTRTAASASTSQRAPTSSRSGQDELDAVAAELNGRPRQTLGWWSPSEKFAEAVAMIP
jgi:IS30 family transposase